MSGRNRGGRRHIGYCPITGKAQYVSKADAKHVARHYAAASVHPFRCDPGCGHWHLGTQGDLTREEHREQHALKVRRYELTHGPIERGTLT